MNARHQLLAAYAEWRRWTELEGQAIESENWPRIRECQDAKQRLQSRIISETDRARQECARLGLDYLDMERQVRTVVSELIQLEARNGEVLSHHRRTAEAERDQLARSSRDLRRVHHSYGGQREAAWTSFS